MAPGPTPPDLPSATLDGILSRIQAGDFGESDPELRRRINLAFAKHHARLRGLVASELRGYPAQQVEDAVQEVLLVAWRRLPEHDGRAFRSWLFAIATRVCANVRRARRDLPVGDDALFDVASEAESVYTALRRSERERILREAATKVLDPKDQEVVYMRYELDLPREEIARLAGLADANAVRVVLQRTRRLLVTELERTLRTLHHGASLLRPDPEER